MEQPDDPARLSLKGEWQLVFDPHNQGLAQDWPGAGWPAERAGPVQVPALWDVTHPQAQGVGFYRRVFTLPAGWRSKVVIFHAAGAAYRAEAWLNGQYAGSHEGAYTPFSFDVTPSVRWVAENVLVVRVAGLARDQAVDGQVLDQAPAAKQKWHYAVGGLWGAVQLEAHEWVAVEAVRVEPDLQRELAHVEVVVHNRRAEHRPVEVHGRITAPDGRLAAELGGRVAVPPGRVGLSYRVSLPRLWAWHPDHPHLYRLAVTVRDGPACEEAQAVRFGMRAVAIHDGQFFLNGSALYLRGVLVQPHYPIGLVAPTDADLLRRELSLAKEAGFNLVRVHLRPAPPGFLDLADELGLLVYAESSLAWIRDSPRMLDHGRREMRALIERDFNHPSVVIWGILNENPPGSALLSEPLLRHARALDATRVVLDNSGGALAIDQDFGWIDRAHVVGPGAPEPATLLDIHLYLGTVLPEPVYEWLRTAGHADSTRLVTDQDLGTPQVLAEFDREARANPGRLLVSELGAAGLMDLDAAIAAFGANSGGRDVRELTGFRDSLHAGFAARGLEALFGTPSGLCRATQVLQAQGVASQLEAVLCNPRASGYVLTHLSDAAWEFDAGLLDVWRQPKAAYQAARRLNQPQALVVHAEAPVGTAGSQLAFTLSRVSQVPPGAGAQVVVTVRGPSGQALPERRFPAAGTAGLHPLGEVVLDLTAPGRYEVQARLVQANRVLAEASQPVLALPPVDWRGISGTVAWLGAPLPVMEQAGWTTAAAGDLTVVGQPGSLAAADWTALLESVAAGQWAVLGPLHRRHALAVRCLREKALELRLSLGIGSWLGCYHWQPNSALFKGLPAGGLAGAEYVDVLPWYVLDELGGEVLAGSVRHTQSLENPVPQFLWHSDIELVRLGSGALIFCQYRVFEPAHRHPLAARLLANLITLAAQRTA